AQLEQTLGVISQLKLALASLRRETRSDASFALMAEGFVDEIARLEAEVNEAIGLYEVGADLWLRVEGQGIEGAATPAEVLTSVVDALRKGLQALTEYRGWGALSARPREAARQAMEVSVAALAPGS